MVGAELAVNAWQTAFTFVLRMTELQRMNLRKDREMTDLK